MAYEVDKAEPYRWGAMCSLGSARFMLLQQSRFPNVVDPTQGDVLISEYSDRLAECDRERFYSIMDKHAPKGKPFQTWLQEGNAKKLLAFLIEITKADQYVPEGRDGPPVWTGFRICGGVNAFNGYPYYVYQVFAKGPASKTKVFTGAKAPNVQGYRSHEDVRFPEGWEW